MGEAVNVFNSSTQREAEAAGLRAFKAILFHIFSVWEGKKKGKKEGPSQA